MEIFVSAVFLMLLYDTTVTGQTTEIPLSGICQNEVREMKPRWGPYVETYIEIYRARCPPPRYGICILSRIGYRHTIGLQHELVYKEPGKCCEGYTQTGVHPLKCEPICTTGCINGSCKRPDECECDEGYERVTKYTCKPVCAGGCDNNSVCVAPGMCACAPGYERNKNGSSECVSACRAGCINGVCSASNTCTCFKGYTASQVPNICMPVCNNKCVNGKCIAPDLCMCLPHHVFSGNEYTCVPSACADCQNGYCEDDVCKCNANYSKDPFNGKCKPLCRRACVNGQCWKPEKCACHEGYAPAEYDQYICNPQCSRQCENGWCSIPEQCTCYNGYRKSENDSYVCESICEQLCLNGSCVNNVCKCDKGYALETNEQYKCVLLNETAAETAQEVEPTKYVGGIETKSPCVFSVRNAIKIESTSSCILFNEIMTVKTKYVCKYLNQLTKNVCINRFCEENSGGYNFCKSFLSCYIITEYVKSNNSNVYTFDCNPSINVTQPDYAVDLNDTDVNESNFTDWFSVEMRINWYDFKIKPFVVIDDTEGTDDSCEWCLCSVDLRPKCDGTPFQLHVCSCPLKSAVYHTHISTTYIVLGIVSGFSILLGFIIAMLVTGHYLWRRHREKNDPLKYKVQEVNCKFGNSRNNVIKELISDDDEDSDTEGNAITVTFEGPFKGYR